MPNLGIIASSISGNLATNSFESIATITPYTTTSTVVFSSIPSTYKHLQIRFIGRTDRANQEDNIQLRFNSDSAGNYAAHVLYGDGATASSFSDGSSITFNTRSVVAAASATSGVFGVGVIDILDYADTNKYKTVRDLFGYDFNGSGRVGMNSMGYNTTSAVTSLSLTGRTWGQYSSFALYGIRGN
jgi:hypothetical protein